MNKKGTAANSVRTNHTTTAAKCNPLACRNVSFGLWLAERLDSCYKQRHWKMHPIYAHLAICTRRCFVANATTRSHHYRALRPCTHRHQQSRQQTGEYFPLLLPLVMEGVNIFFSPFTRHFRKPRTRTKRGESFKSRRPVQKNGQYVKGTQKSVLDLCHSCEGKDPPQSCLTLLVDGHISV